MGVGVGVCVCVCRGGVRTCTLFMESKSLYYLFLLKLSILVEVCSEYFIFYSSRFLVPIGSWAPWASCHFCPSALGLRSSCYGLFRGSGGATAVSPGWADGTAEAGIQTSRDNGAPLGFSVAGTEDLLPDSLSASAGLWGSGRHGISILVNVLFSLVG